MNNYAQMHLTLWYVAVGQDIQLMAQITLDVIVSMKQTYMPPDKSVYRKIIFFIFHPKHVVGTQKNRLNETFFLCNQYIW